MSKKIIDTLYNKYPLILMVLVVISIFNVAVVFFINSSLSASAKQTTSTVVSAPAESVVDTPVTLTVLSDSSCSDCFDMQSFVDSMKQAGVVVSKEDVVDYESEQGALLASAYEIKRVPALIISKDIENYSSIIQALNQMGTNEKDDSYVFQTLQPPYKDTETNKIRGLVDLVNLVDGSCDSCYNVSSHKDILQQGYGVVINSEVTYDISSAKGKQLLTKYNITSVPTILISPESEVYQNLNSIWGQVGTVEDDGWYVFRDETSMINFGGYKNLETGEFIDGPS